MASKLGEEININKKIGGGEKKLDYWRQYFRKSNSDIFDVIENSIMVAAVDFPKEYRVRKAGIAELLFSCKLTRCLSCDRVELDIGRGTELDHGDDDGGGNRGDPSSNVSYGDVEALNDLIEQEKEVINEVLRIKNILYNSQDESDSVLFESLRRLQLMRLSINILKETEIGKAVNHIKRHSSENVRNIARSLIGEWKIIVDEWMETAKEVAEGTPDSINPSTIEEEEGLPSPPMDEGVFFSAQPMDFTQFFDGMDDDGNPRNCGKSNKNLESGTKPCSVKPDTPKRRQEPQAPKGVPPISKDNRVQQMKRLPPVPKPSKPSNMPRGASRQLKPNGDVKISRDSMLQPKLEKPVVQRRPVPQPEKVRPLNDESVQEMLEASKRKLQERYQQAENAKKQRTIQVMDIQDLPKQGLVNRNPHAKFGNNSRNWANGRK